MTEQFVEDYFTAKATSSIDIAHTVDDPSFFPIRSKVDPAEFDNAVRSISKDIVLLLEFGSGNLTAGDSPADSMRIGLHVLVKTDEDYANIRAARNLAKSILSKFIAAMRRDCQPRYIFSETEAGPLNIAKIIFDQTIKYDNMDGIDNGNWWGKVCYFDLKASAVDLTFNAEDWI